MTLLYEVKRKAGEGFLSAGFFESDIPAEIVAGLLSKDNDEEWIVVHQDVVYRSSQDWKRDHNMVKEEDNGDV